MVVKELNIEALDDNLIQLVLDSYQFMLGQLNFENTYIRKTKLYCLDENLYVCKLENNFIIYKDIQSAFERLYLKVEDDTKKIYLANNQEIILKDDLVEIRDPYNKLCNRLMITHENNIYDSNRQLCFGFVNWFKSLSLVYPYYSPASYICKEWLGIPKIIQYRGLLFKKLYYYIDEYYNWMIYNFQNIKSNLLDEENMSSFYVNYHFPFGSTYTLDTLPFLDKSCFDAVSELIKIYNNEDEMIKQINDICNEFKEDNHLSKVKG